MRVWLYRLQHRLALTRNESVALLTLVGLFLAGLGAQAARMHNTPPLPPTLAVQNVAAPDSGAAFAEPEPAVINVNTASPERLQDLPGIGPALSGRIETYRQQQPFQTVDDLRAVRGIGPKTMEALRPLVTVDAAEPAPTAVSEPGGEAP
jgi:competence protein ComEA